MAEQDPELEPEIGGEGGEDEEERLYRRRGGGEGGGLEFKGRDELMTRSKVGLLLRGEGGGEEPVVEEREWYELEGL